MSKNIASIIKKVAPNLIMVRLEITCRKFQTDRINNIMPARIADLENVKINPMAKMYVDTANIFRYEFDPDSAGYVH